MFESGSVLEVDRSNDVLGAKKIESLRRRDGGDPSLGGKHPSPALFTESFPRNVTQP